MYYLTCSGLPAPTHNFSFAKCRVPARGGQNTVMQLTKWGLRGTEALCPAYLAASGPSCSQSLHPTKVIQTDSR